MLRRQDRVHRGDDFPLAPTQRALPEVTGPGLFDLLARVPEFRKAFPISLVDSGASDHVTNAGLERALRPCEANYTTANGGVSPTEVGVVTTPVGVVTDAVHIETSPNLLSVGALVEENSCEFDWTPAKGPWIILPAGETLYPVVHNRVPHLGMPDQEKFTVFLSKLTDTFFNEVAEEFLDSEEAETFDLKVADPCVKESVPRAAGRPSTHGREFSSDEDGDGPEVGERWMAASGEDQFDEVDEHEHQLDEPEEQEPPVEVIPPVAPFPRPTRPAPPQPYGPLRAPTYAQVPDQDGNMGLLEIPPMPRRAPPPPPPDHPEWFTEMHEWFANQREADLPVYGPPEEPPRLWGWSYLLMDIVPGHPLLVIHSYTNAKTFPHHLLSLGAKAHGEEYSSDEAGDGPEYPGILFRGLDMRRELDVLDRGCWAKGPNSPDLSHFATVQSSSNRTPWIPLSRESLAALYFATSRGNRPQHECNILVFNTEGFSPEDIVVLPLSIRRRAMR